jgi:hypothetical protein
MNYKYKYHKYKTLYNQIANAADTYIDKDQIEEIINNQSYNKENDTNRNLNIKYQELIDMISKAFPESAPIYIGSGKNSIIIKISSNLIIRVTNCKKALNLSKSEDENLIKYKERINTYHGTVINENSIRSSLNKYSNNISNWGILLGCKSTEPEVFELNEDFEMFATNPIVVNYTTHIMKTPDKTISDEELKRGIELSTEINTEIIILNFSLEPYIDGLSLQQKSRAGIVTTIQQKNKLLDMLRFYWIDRQYAHADLTPGNIMQNSNGDWYIIDIGTTRSFESHDMPNTYNYNIIHNWLKKIDHPDSNNFENIKDALN